MTPSTPATPGKPTNARPSDKKERLAKALKANLLRRKAAAAAKKQG